MLCENRIRISSSVAGVLIALTALLAGCRHDAAPAPSFPPVELDRMITARMDAGLIPGVLVGISDPRYGTFTKAYGVADVASGRPASVDDHVRIASVTKTFTATAILRLADEGRLALDTPMEQFVPGLPYGADITIGDLLGMHAGVISPDVADDAFLAQLLPAPPQRQWQEGDTLRAILDHPESATPPRTTPAYSNGGYYLLGSVLEKVTGRPVHQILTEIADQHGLHDTGYPTDATLPAPDSRGYAYDNGTLTDVTTRTPPALFGAAGSMYSTVTDLLRYAPLLARGDLLKPGTHALRTQFTDVERAGEYGFGLQKIGSWLGHTGAVSGYTTKMMYLPEREVSVVVLANRNTEPMDPLRISAGDIWNAIVAELYPEHAPHPAVAVESPLPAVPTVAELDARLQQALDPNLPATQKVLRISEDEADPELITEVARSFADAAAVLHIDKLTMLEHGTLMATATMTAGSRRIPQTIPFVPRDGTWRIANDWVCLSIGDTGSPACSAER
ncbi:serine hydrolase domain-containing protein [Nocardia sp. NPDC050712]|uniref:serine hydrolase domain-containing protein n=1 Tax=Nocardia sp. NPDC050712 TaxID=3155518 RepID=UPI0033F4A6EE